jgi:cAMP-dependent protein kinase regulator
MISTEETKELKTYEAGDYFGERSLLKNEPRAANVIALTEVTVVSVDRHSFKRLMGPLDELLRRKMQTYEQFHSIIKPSLNTNNEND